MNSHLIAAWMEYLDRGVAMAKVCGNSHDIGNIIKSKL